MTSILARFIRPALLPFLIATMLVAGIAASPAIPAQPNQPTATATANAGEISIRWNPAAGTQFYTVGWINRNEFQEMQAAGRDWQDAFHYATIPATYTTHLVKGLKPNEGYFAIVGAQTARFGANPVWSTWSPEVTTAPLQSTPSTLPSPIQTPAQALPGIILDPYALLLDETQTGNLTVRLASRPDATVSVRLSSGDATAATVSPTVVTVSPDTWNIRQNVTVSASQDGDSDHENVTITVTSTSTDTAYNNLTTALKVLVNDTTGQHGEGFCPITGLPLPAGGYLSVGESTTDAGGQQFTLVSASRQATVNLDGTNYRPILGRQWLKVCGKVKAPSNSSGIMLAGYTYNLDTDAGSGFVALDDNVTTWLDVGLIPAGQTRNACEVWDIANTASTVIVTINNFQANPALFSVDLP